MASVILITLFSRGKTISKLHLIENKITLSLNITIIFIGLEKLGF
jgi:hypothetical protein